MTLQPSTIGGLDDRARDGRRQLSRLGRRHPHARGRRPRPQRAGERHAGAERDRAVEPDGPRRHAEPRGRSASCSKQPLGGIGKVDATVTGNRRELQATGQLVGDGVKYGDNGALTVSSDFTAQRSGSRLWPTRHVVADTHATFVSVGGPEHQRARREDDLRAEAARLRRDGEAAAAVARRRRLAAAASGSSGSSPAEARPRDAGPDRGSWRRARQPTIKYGARCRDGVRSDAGQRRSADRGRRHVRPAGRRAEGDADQRRSRERRRAAAAAAAVDRARSTRSRRRVDAARPRTRRTVEAAEFTRFDTGRLPAVPLRRRSAAP